MKTTKAPAAAATAVLAAVLGSTHHCAQAFLVSAPVRNGGSSSSSASLPTRSSWASQAAQQQQQRRREGLTGLSMVSATFGEKINTDRIVMDKTAREAVQELYPEACAKHPRFLDEIGHGETRTFTEEELRKRLEVAHVFVSLANLVLLSRGKNVLAEDFKYYSPGTGRLDRDSFLRLTKTLDVAFSTFRVTPTDFVVYKDGTVTYRRTFRAVHDGYLTVGDKTYPPSQTKVISDVDLCAVSFDDMGVVLSYAYGLMVEVVYAIEDPEAVAEIEAIKKRVVNQQAKMKSLEGQESSIAYSKCKSDIDVMKLDMEALLERVNSAPNTEGLGGIPGLFAAVGAEFPEDLKNLEGTDAEGDIEGMRLASFSYPVEVKDYEAFDTDSFTEMK
ncbi:unnamed protein product [Ectocarpus sp. 12 AP-2014]